MTITAAWALVAPARAPVPPPAAPPPTGLRAPRGPQPQAPELTTLVDPAQEILYRRTARRETDCSTALVRGLSDYLKQLHLDFPGGRRALLGSVVETWAEPETQAQYPAVNVRGVDRGRYEPKSFTPVLTGEKLEDGRYLIEPAEYVLPMHVELYATDANDRSTIAAAIEEALNPFNSMAGFRLVLPHYFGQLAHYLLNDNEYADDEASARQGLQVLRFFLTGNVPQTRLATIPTVRRVSAVTQDSNANSYIGPDPLT